MVSINYPEPGFRIKKVGEKEFIFDPLRKKWVVLTPEEWVRQNFLQYLIQVKNYPSTLIAVEKLIELGELKKRFDILVYDRNQQPWMMIECKSMDVALDEEVLFQLLRYNIGIPVPFLVITNGSHCFGGERKEGKLEIITDLPEHL